jgi:hypothetical protein
MAARKKCRELAVQITKVVMEDTPLPDTPFTEYHILWNHFGTVMPDDDNVVARIKSYKDGIADALGINDRSIHLGSVRFIRDRATQKKLWITLT